ncbi:LysE family translocator [Spiribacter halobius]|uniref:LysE family translocator n=1 Tax=Sediminicurvatus halobius TaxID=2182432 RepID=A0A2U2MY78_9GAMM|nr:LysE family translocator [Spiribacter halobius]PWG61644.1 LysE family translocator [Spiribacter halobius]UEX79458.1 LysE family translocator [Spiribacter halobius]
MSLESWFLFLAVSLVPAMSPGPAVVLALSNSLRFSPRATLWSALGNALGLLVLGAAVTLGLGGLIAASASAFTALKLLGAAYLVYLGVRIWRRGAGEMECRVTAGAARPGRLFREGLLVAVTNPKAMIILVALLPPFLDSSAAVWLQGSILSLTYAVLCFLNHMLVAICAEPLRLALRSPRGQRMLRRGLGGTFVGVGAALAASGP